MFRFAPAALAAGIMLIAAPATAGQGDWYVRGDAGFVFGGDTFDGDIFVPGDHEVDTDGGWSADVAAGYLVESDLRAEIEVGYSSRDTDDGQLFGAPLATVSGDIDAVTVTLNLIHDIPHTIFGATPFIGVGAGWLYVDADYVSTNAATIATNDSDSDAVVKAMAGFAVPVTDNIDATLMYQYAHSFNDLRFATGPAGVPPIATYRTDYDEHRVSLGVRVGL